ncbi:luciferase family oxidoreductase, group 1 [Salinimicrobium catena]|uniref:Luciferase-like monooxygenase n=1 Tax=Salinimicrobium catena TaxID=390640 RepID=A0A1H5M194_9FLAO|nr:LLM class flavin-dependent oxidoreductase [Salinimicrobium catena]SDL17306.1 luciferase family oxidoreductase, group 1 [Salinimicrobium catena]SEE83073.1 luciferase family oxidoreductase, group 1 [Salinimicrobium catena]
MTPKPLQQIDLSVLDLVPVIKGNTIADSFKNTLDLANRCDELGFTRFWISEHHNMESVASSATAVLLGQVAANTSRIRVGSGGIMLPNHSPLMVAEQFGTLETLFPGRIDLGLGRAPGTDQQTAAALRRGRTETVEDFPKDIAALQKYFSAANKNAAVRAIPGEGLDIPLYLLGSSTFSAQLAAMFGLSYAFASHFAPAYLQEALQLYREKFRPSENLKKPYSIACVNVIAAETDEEAEFLASSQKLFALGIIRNQRKPMPPPVNNLSELWNKGEEAAISQMMKYSFVGSKTTIEDRLSEFIKETEVDEIMAVSHIFNHESRIRSYEILSEIKEPLKDPFFDSQPPIE